MRVERSEVVNHWEILEFCTYRDYRITKQVFDFLGKLSIQDAEHTKKT